MNPNELISAVGRSRRTSIVGLAKNAGKTTVLNFLVEELAGRGRFPGIASIGRDGEQFDIINLKRKPRIALPPGCSCVTSSRVATDGLTLLEELGPRGVLGMPGIYRNEARAFDARDAEDGGQAMVELAGVNRISAMERALERLERYSAPLIVDGALDRRSQGSPSLSDGVVLTCGATMGRSVGEVVRKTMAQVRLLMLSPPERVPGDDRSGEIRPVPGALTDRKLRSAIREGFCGTLLVEDWTRIFLSESAARLLSVRGISLSVITPAKLLAITVNPHNPTGPDLESSSLLDGLGVALAESGLDIPCVDVRA